MKESNSRDTATGGREAHLPALLFFLVWFASSSLTSTFFRENSTRGKKKKKKHHVIYSQAQRDNEKRDFFSFGFTTIYWSSATHYVSNHTKTPLSYALKPFCYQSLVIFFVQESNTHSLTHYGDVNHCSSHCWSRADSRFVEVNILRYTSFLLFHLWLCVHEEQQTILFTFCDEN